MSILNDILQRSFVGDDPNSAMKWFDRDRYYKMKEDERKQQMLADAQKQASVDAMAAQAERGSIARDLGLVSSVLNDRRAGQIVDFLGGSEGLEKGFPSRSFIEASPEGQRAALAEMQTKGYLNVAPGNYAHSLMSGLPNIMGESKETQFLNGIPIGEKTTPPRIAPIETALAASPPLASAVNAQAPAASIAEGEPRVEDKKSAIRSFLEGVSRLQKEVADFESSPQGPLLGTVAAPSFKRLGSSIPSFSSEPQGPMHGPVSAPFYNTGSQPDVLQNPLPFQSILERALDLQKRKPAFYYSETPDYISSPRR